MTQPTKWSAPLGSGADVQDLPDDDLRYASFSKIFPQITQVPLSAGGVAPRRIDFNSLFKLLADNIYYYQNGGVFEYSDTSDYEKGALVRYNDKIYLCIQDNSALNTHNPEDMNYWLKVALNNELADYLPLTGGNLTGNLTVQNKNVVRSVNGVDADTSGNVTISTSLKVDYSSGINITSSLGQGQTWTAPENGILIHTSQSDDGVCYISHTHANDYRNYNLPNWLIYNNTGSGDYQSAMAIVNENLVIYGASNADVIGTLMFYPFK